MIQIPSVFSIKSEISKYKYAQLMLGNDIEYLYGNFKSQLALSNHKIDFLSSASSFEQLQNFIDSNKKSIFGYLGYDLKNEIETLESNNIDNLHFDNIFFFPAEKIIENPKLETYSNQDFDFPKFDLKCNFSKEDYVNTVNQIKSHIQRGDIYELNLCIEFSISNIEIDPFDVFLRLNAISPMPFACFIKNDFQYMMCASPERFLKKINTKIVSQPIKGTARRGADSGLDDKAKWNLLHSEKEKSENIMIVDLVRNDLSHFAEDGSVKVEELCKLYSFQKVHQLISTVSCQVDDNEKVSEIIKSCFPMGSMTGAPKLSAMQLIEKFEKSKRGLFSGAVGYIAENQDFDFNVVIRSVLYNAQKKYLSFQAGSAITIDCDPEQEWNECLVKIQPILECLQLEKVNFD